MGVTVSKGFLVYAQNTNSVDYITQAYALALSIKSTQSTYSNISIVTDDAIPDEYLSVFDKVIPKLFTIIERDIAFAEGHGLRIESDHNGREHWNQEKIHSKYKNEKEWQRPVRATISVETNSASRICNSEFVNDF